MRPLALAVLLLASIAAEAAAQSPLPPYRARVLGVFDMRSGDPIEGVEVIDLASGTWALTTKTGTVSLAFLPEGESSIRLRKVGYAAVERPVRISPADTTPITVILSPVVTVLPDVVTVDTASHYISPGLRDFEERRKRRLGQYITEAELRKNDNRELPDVLRKLTGANVRCSTRTPRVCLIQSSRFSSYCPYVVYLDGQRMADANLLNYNVTELAAIEAYTGTTAPAQYADRRGNCGVLLLWSRER